MSLTQAALDARKHADRTGELGDESPAAALEDTVAAAAAEQLSELAPHHDTTGISTPDLSGFVSSVWVERG